MPVLFSIEQGYVPVVRESDSWKNNMYSLRRCKPRNHYARARKFKPLKMYAPAIVTWSDSRRQFSDDK